METTDPQAQRFLVLKQARSEFRDALARLRMLVTETDNAVFDGAYWDCRRASNHYAELLQRHSVHQLTNFATKYATVLDSVANYRKWLLEPIDNLDWIDRADETNPA